MTEAKKAQEAEEAMHDHETYAVLISTFGVLSEAIGYIDAVTEQAESTDVVLKLRQSQKQIAELLRSGRP